MEVREKPWLAQEATQAARLQHGRSASQVGLRGAQGCAVGDDGAAQRSQAGLQAAQRLLPRQSELERARQRRALARRVRRRILRRRWGFKQVLGYDPG